MTTSKLGRIIIKTLVSLSFSTTKNYEENLQTLLHLINIAQDDSFIVAPEVALSGFDYENLESALAFASVASEALLGASQNKTIVVTMLERVGGEIFNVVKVFSKGILLHQRAKARLFRLGDEHKFMSEGSDEAIKIIELDGVKIAILICFELRFKELWQKIEGADVIALPAWWGVLRAEHFRILSEALAITNQCYVVASDSTNAECSGLSGIISPQGKAQRNGNKPCLEVQYDKKEIALMRRYLDVGIK